VPAVSVVYTDSRRDLPRCCVERISPYDITVECDHTDIQSCQGSVDDTGEQKVPEFSAVFVAMTTPESFERSLDFSLPTSRAVVVPRDIILPGGAQQCGALRRGIPRGGGDILGFCGRLV
jgi:hypothetical protein